MKLAYWLLLGTTNLAAIALWRIQCEGFGCTGVGIAWLAWSVLYLLSLGFGLIALSKLAQPEARRGIRLPIIVQLAVGIALGGYWLLHT